MGETEYSEALKQGKKEYRARIAKGQFPYLPVLDEILSEADIKTEQYMGLVGAFGFRCRNKHHGQDIFICGKLYADIGRGNRICSEVV